MPLRKAAAACGVLACVFAAATPLVAGSAAPGYRHCTQSISELGATGAPHAGWVSFAGFLPTGVLTFLFAALAVAGLASGTRERAGLVLFSGVGLAYVAAAFFPCDPGCPVSGSTTQAVHNAFGAVEYLGGGLGLFLLAGAWPRGPAFGALARICGVVVVLAFAALLVPGQESVRGLLQRAAELALFGWLLAVSVHLAQVPSP